MFIDPVPLLEAGADFDKEYMSEMVTDHSKALNASRQRQRYEGFKATHWLCYFG